LLRELVKSAVTSKTLKDGEVETESDAKAWSKVLTWYRELGSTGEPHAAVNALAGLRMHSRIRTFRAELIRDTTKALAALAEGKHATLADSAYVTRQRVSHMGRHLPRRTVSTPLLLKGLEFDRAAIPDAVHFYNEKDQGTRAKLFYVAVSRARSSLIISSSSPSIQFPLPN
jgi:DNA helicase-2/ATP-dependent DNA helicase PcrA